MKKLGVLLGVVALLLGGIYFATRPEDTSAILTELSAEELGTKMEQGEAFTIYVYSDTCNYCKVFKPTLLDYLKENKQSIYQVNVTNEPEWNQVKGLLGDKFQGTPALFSFTDGKIADYRVGNLPKEELANYAKINDQSFKK